MKQLYESILKEHLAHSRFMFIGFLEETRHTSGLANTKAGGRVEGNILPILLLTAGNNISSLTLCPKGERRVRGKRVSGFPGSVLPVCVAGGGDAPHLVTTHPNTTNSCHSERLASCSSYLLEHRMKRTSSIAPG